MNQKPLDVNVKLVKQLKEIRAPCRLLLQQKNNNFIPLKIIYEPYFSTMQSYMKLEHLEFIWQKLLFKIGKNEQIIQRVYNKQKNLDPLIAILMEIYLQVKNKLINQDTITLFRIDYFLNQTYQLKLIQFNVNSVSMMVHTESNQKAQQIIRPDIRFPSNKPLNIFIQTIDDYYKEKSLKGSFIFVVSAQQSNIVEQKIIQMHLLERKINCLRLTLTDLKEIVLEQDGNLLYNNVLISVVYFRVGYTLSHYNGHPQHFKDCRLKIAKSNALSIPNIAMELVNQKRMQAELTQKNFLQQFLSPQEVLLIRNTFVQMIILENLTEKEVQQKMKNCQKYIMKPNLQGGGNNLLGKQMLTIDKRDWNKYIIMERIQSLTFDNIIINQEQSQTICIYQFSKFGILKGKGQKIIQNITQGYLIRAKPQYEKQGGIINGCGSLGAWAIIE